MMIIFLLILLRARQISLRQGNSVVISAGVTEACSDVKMVLKKYIKVARISYTDSNHDFL